MSGSTETALAELLDEVAAGEGRIVFLTGAGISAEVGIPTFRGPEGYWRVGSVNYHPQELATFDAFSRMPDDVWSWYLYRRAVCRAAKPGVAHLALAELEQVLGDRMLLATQNVDGLHLRAGSSLERMYQIHGNIDYMRCVEECGSPIVPVPVGALDEWPKERRVAEAERALLTCARCGARTRPHVLWFDETYDEPRYHFESSQRAATEAALLVIIGTSGSTNLPLIMATLASRAGAALIVINLDPSPFTTLATRTPRSHTLLGPATQHLPPITTRLRGRSSVP